MYSVLSYSRSNKLSLNNVNNAVQFLATSSGLLLAWDLGPCQSVSHLPMYSYSYPVLCPFPLAQGGPWTNIDLLN